MTWLCPRPCGNKTADGYCGTSWCINPMYSNIGTANEKPMGGLRKTTNADRIRAMTDEELDGFLNEVQGDAYLVGFHARAESRFTPYGKIWLEWLKQEVSTNG